MSEKEKVELCCDRCGAKVMLDAKARDAEIVAINRPTEWAKVRHSSVTTGVHRACDWDICGRCNGHFRDWLNNRNEVGSPAKCLGCCIEASIGTQDDPHPVPEKFHTCVIDKSLRRPTT